MSAHCPLGYQREWFKYVWLSLELQDRSPPGTGLAIPALESTDAFASFCRIIKEVLGFFGLAKLITITAFLLGLVQEQKRRLDQGSFSNDQWLIKTSKILGWFGNIIWVPNIFVCGKAQPTSRFGTGTQPQKSIIWTFWHASQGWAVQSRSLCNSYSGAWVEGLKDKSQKSVPTLQSVPQQRIQFWVKLCLLFQHVEEQLVLGGTVDLSLLETPFHHLYLRFLLSSLQTLKAHNQDECQMC